MHCQFEHDWHILKKKQGALLAATLSLTAKRVQRNADAGLKTVAVPTRLS